MRRFVLAGLLAACTSESGDPGITGLSEVEYYELQEVRPYPIDMLFVIDNTTAMAAYQDRIAMLPSLVEQVLATAPGGMPDMRIAVTTNDGQLRPVSAGGDPYLADTLELDYSHATNFAGSFVDALAGMMNVGAASTGANQPLAAHDLALDGGFLRAPAPLAIVTITASDDASPGAVTDYAAALKTVKNDPGNVLVTGIYTKPATRLDEFHAQFPNRSLTISIDDADWSGPVGLFTQLVRTTLGVLCHREPADVDPTTPGPQYECTMSAFANNVERVLPPCKDGGPEPCWYFVAEPSCSELDYDVQLKVRGYPGTYHPTIRGQCLVN